MNSNLNVDELDYVHQFRKMGILSNKNCYYELKMIKRKRNKDVYRFNAFRLLRNICSASIQDYTRNSPRERLYYLIVGRLIKNFLDLAIIITSKVNLKSFIDEFFWRKCLRLIEFYPADGIKYVDFKEGGEFTELNLEEDIEEVIDDDV
ncbi:hypothetical protein BpHYR1_006688 [Brachionus plicatilis]|uniref:Uncharacterized protein n=1 Tax=Brachionus plicatilis TaxID=10195 RepID=A0A3M7S3A0_BRAPC|nr:hypothetical protein BpHYR1_006688 [Brachionus plicatilis]